MTHVMQACAENDVKLYILDRPNPLGGIIDGPILNVEHQSFVGMHPIPIRHGMTIGELAYMINESGWLKNNLKTDLYIIKMQGWNREMYYDETGLEFIPPSPNILDLETAFIFPFPLSGQGPSFFPQSVALKAGPLFPAAGKEEAAHFLAANSGPVSV